MGNRRERRARRQDIEIVGELSSGRYRVNGNRGIAYTVDLGEMSCTCPDWQKRQPTGGCKHIRKVRNESESSSGTSAKRKETKSEKRSQQQRSKQKQTEEVSNTGLLVAASIISGLGWIVLELIFWILGLNPIGNIIQFLILLIPFYTVTLIGKYSADSDRTSSSQSESSQTESNADDDADDNSTKSLYRQRETEPSPLDRR